MIFEIIKYPNRIKWNRILQRPTSDMHQVEEQVSSIFQYVRLDGDKALVAVSKKFNEKFRIVSTREIMNATKQVSKELKDAIQTAKRNIEKFHLTQIDNSKIVETVKGVKCWRKSIAIDSVGLYIPGGSAPLFSTVLMLGVPAMIAGCSRIVLCTPASKSGIHPAILFTANLIGIKEIYQLGGAQAIAAMAYGTNTIPKVNKVFGPGNRFVTCAKQLVQKDGIAIDLPAGPSEVAILADKSCIPSFVAADLLSQAEHGPDSQVVLISNSEITLKEVQKELVVQLEQLPRKEIAVKALQCSKFILVKNKTEGIELLNEYAPEHLILSCKDSDKLAQRIINAGSVFIGNFSPESVGDYASGTNHTLPTNGYAKAYGGVSLDSFVKKITFQKLTPKGLQRIGKTVEIMAEAEGLLAHKNAVSLRLQKIKKK